MPDWPPRTSASEFPEGFRRYGSTGQLFEVRNRQWTRVDSPPPSVLENRTAP